MKEKLIPILLVYERLPMMCLNCGKIGHLARESPEVDFGSVDNSSVEQNYSTWLKAQLVSSKRSSHLIVCHD